MGNYSLNETYTSLYEKERFLSVYLNRVRSIGYTVQEVQYLYGQIDLITELMNVLSKRILSDLLMESSNRRLDEIVSGIDILIDIIRCPEDYKLIIDLKDLNNENVLNALIFKDIRQKYC